MIRPGIQGLSLAECRLQPGLQPHLRASEQVVTPCSFSGAATTAHHKHRTSFSHRRGGQNSEPSRAAGTEGPPGECVQLLASPDLEPPHFPLRPLDTLSPSQRQHLLPGLCHHPLCPALTETLAGLSALQLSQDELISRPLT